MVAPKRMKLLAAFASICDLSVHASQQLYNFSEPGFGAHDRLASTCTIYNSFDAFGDMTLLSETSYTALALPLFPNHSLRIKRSHICEEEPVNTYTGYLDINENMHLFFYFFESRGNSEEDDVVFWTNSGSACSSAAGLFMEHGPCLIREANKTQYNPHSWNEVANIFYIDSPAGAGFSFQEHGVYVSTTEEASEDIAIFMTIFFEHFFKFKGRGFHMAGESYAGHSIPVFASTILDHNAKLVEAGLTPINLKSIMLGNGLTDAFEIMLSRYDMMCTPASVKPILPISKCIRMKEVVTRCRKWGRGVCIDEFDHMNCKAVTTFCENEITEVFRTTDMNPYDLNKRCEGPYLETLCYPVTRYIDSFLSLPEVQDSLGVDPAVRGRFASCNMKLQAGFHDTLDMYHTSVPYVSALLERSIRVIAYVGTNDWMCNWIGNERWALAMEWSGRKEFLETEARDWIVDNEVVGKVRTARDFTFVYMNGAGHMAPYDKPRESLRLISRWINADAV
ncbi:alpha/beta-hydrolase [Punctularia strigosozonata HHB-11173 SS5]|uniref:alpha/beta-hydrolase n=1 Tax=Punctularia strigosozonata (strain HHB-11173) TaxID=741275 RepID=UPI000441808B|nr:alpha/beta-hydrolase [Punctularia strigosozonata HHB-11173 SS5]EIN08472.1 alpha/beta-hydrolase [Punctularia strigosozonata HHB-11173 SS5]